MTQKFSRKTFSIFLSIIMILSMFPLSAITASAAPGKISTVADLSTMDDWRHLFFPNGNISTENAGGVWMDKSVFTDTDAFTGTGISMNGDNRFLVALSAIASNRSITGTSQVPTDSMLVLDVSGSMGRGSGNNNVAEDLVEAANESIATLLNASAYNRVGVVLYSGPRNQGGAASANDAVLVLPLGRYTTGADGEYLSYGDGSSETVSLDRDVRYENTTTAPTERSKTVVGATYIQKGIALAMQQFTAANNSPTVEDPVSGTLQRKPIMVLMSDGAPTVGSTSFTNPSDIHLGDGSEPSAALGFVTQLSAAYAKAQIEAKYGTDSLFYTLGLGVDDDDIALSVVDPGNQNGSTAVADFWRQYNSTDTGETVTVQSAFLWIPRRAVTKIATPLEQDYVDRYFPVSASSDLAEDLKQAFRDIVGEIQLQSTYFPTLIAENEDLSGYISFVDRIGEYMEVTAVEGILIDNQLFSGADLARNFIPSGGDLGTYDNPTALGHEMIEAVRARLGIADYETARTLVRLAYQNGQLRWNSPSDFSNYIGWYANAAGQFLGFYHEGLTELPDATGNPATDPAFTVKSYGYLGGVNEGHGVTGQADMMYATVQVRENINTGEQLVTFAIPAALIPIVSYDVTLNEAGALIDLEATGAEHPIRLVYEVGLREDINPFTVMDIVSDDYLLYDHDLGNGSTEPRIDPHIVNSDGSINFYTNQWDHNNVTNYGTINTYAYFNPSRLNDRYYYTDDRSIVYTDTLGTPYVGTTKPENGDFYRAITVYLKSSTLEIGTVYEKISAKSLEYAEPDPQNNQWHIPAGIVHTSIDGYAIPKDLPVPTGTLSHSNIPFVDAENHEVNEAGYDFFVGATLGNNGRLTVIPETGIRLSKAMAPGVTAPATPFAFTLTNTGNASDNATYPAYLIKANGDAEETSVKFSGGIANVSLYAGDVLYIGGMDDVAAIAVAETETAAYTVQSVSGLTDGVVTVEDGVMKPVNFVNTTRGTGHLTIAKEIEHDFGTDYSIPDGKTFTIDVTLSGIGVANVPFEAKQTNSNLSRITPDGDGKFTVTLGHEEQLELFDLPAGTVATVVERDPGDGFTATYWDNGVLGDGKVTVQQNNTVSVMIINDYAAAPVDPVNLTVTGSKRVNNEEGEALTDWGSYEFTVVLERYGDNGWDPVEEITVDNDNRSFTFDLANENFDAPGVYSYQVYEYEPALGDSDRIPGMIYDLNWYTFSVFVSDTDLDGRLDIVRIYDDRLDRDITANNNAWTINTNFVNTQSQSVPALVTIDVTKELINNSASTLVTKAGFQFGLYTDENCTTPVDDTVLGVSLVDRVTTDAVGEGWIDVVFDEAGDYTFYLKEIDTGIAGVTYSPTVVQVEVTVDLDGTDLVATSVNYTKLNPDVGVETDGYHADDGTVWFTNVYDPADASLPITFVDKELSGRAVLDSDNFTFRVEEVNLPAGATPQVLTGRMVEDGNDPDLLPDVSFNAPLTFTRVGTYFFNVTETGEDEAGVTIDRTVYRMTVTVTDQGGTLSARYTLLNAVGDDIVFRNVYTPEAATVRLSGSKTLTGRPLLNDEFTFVLTEAINAAGDIGPGAKTYEALNFADGSFRFPALTYTQASDQPHYYLVTEKAGTDEFGIRYDATAYVVAVQVTDNTAIGKLETTVTYTVKGGAAVPALAFENVYVPRSVASEIPGKKTLDGRVLGEGNFSFLLYQSNDDWTQGRQLDIVSNDASGDFSFTAPDYTNDDAAEFSAAGSYYYLIKEQYAGQTIDGVTYSEQVFRIRIDVTDDLQGQLHSVIHIFDAENVPQTEIRFINVYEVTEGDTVHLNGTKTLTGRDLQKGEFTFELYETDEAFEASGELLLTATNDENGLFGFDLEFGPDHVGNVFFYLVKEKNEQAPGITYSDTVYQVTVWIEDNELGGVRVLMEISDGENPAAALNFTNVFTPDPVPEPEPEPEPEEPTRPESPKTGDTSLLPLWIALLFVSGGTAVGITLTGKKKKEDRT